MVITRSSKCSLKFTNKSKLVTLNLLLEEYSKAVNYFINLLKHRNLKQGQFIETIVINSFNHDWMTHRLKKCACREAVGMLVSYQSKLKKGDKKVNLPKHYGKSMTLQSTCVDISLSQVSGFDYWLVIHSVGNKIKFNLPIKSHRHFNKLLLLGKLNKPVTITKDSVFFSFEIDTGKKKEVKKIVGLDTGINALASLSDGNQLGREVKFLINKIKRKKQGSKKQKKS